MYDNLRTYLSVWLNASQRSTYCVLLKRFDMGVKCKVFRTKYCAIKENTGEEGIHFRYV